MYIFFDTKNIEIQTTLTNKKQKCRKSGQIDRILARLLRYMAAKSKNVMNK